MLYIRQIIFFSLYTEQIYLVEADIGLDRVHPYGDKRWKYLSVGGFAGVGKGCILFNKVPKIFIRPDDSIK